MGLYIDEDGELRENGADDTGSEYPVAPVVVPGYGGEAPNYGGEAPIDFGESPPRANSDDGADADMAAGLIPEVELKEITGGKSYADWLQSAMTPEARAAMEKIIASYGTPLWNQLKGILTNPAQLAVLGGGLLAASRPNSATPTGYQGKIPKLTATSNMLTAPPVGRRPGSGGIDYGGGATYRDEAGKIVSSNERTLAELREAAQTNPYNRGATYEARDGLGATSLDELLAAMKPSEATTAANAAANTANTAAAASASNAAGLAALTAAINAARPTASSAPAAPSGGGIATGAPRPATSGNTAALREQLRAEYASGPKTQDQLDSLLLKYPPAVLQAEFPEFGGVADYNNAAREAYQRTEQKQREESRAAMRADMARTGEEVRVANPGGNVQVSGLQSPTMSAIPQSELLAARAKLTPEQAAFIDWQLSQVNPLTGQRVSDAFALQGTNPYESGARAQEQIDRSVRRTDLLSQAGVSTAGIAPWTDPNWQATQQVKEDAERARMDKQTADWFNTPEAQRPIAGPGPSVAPSGYGNYLDKPAYTPPSTTGAITEWYDANAGKGTQTDLDNWLANSGYTAKEIATALPQWGESDLQKAIDAAKVSVAAPAPAPTPTAVAPAPAQPAPAPKPAEEPYYFESGMGAAKGGIVSNGFVLPADVVSHFGNGSSEAGLKLLAERIGATPIKGEGDGMSDSIKTKIDGVQEARVANDEAYVSPEMVKKLGNGSPEKGARKLYAMMDQVRKARTGTTKQGKEIDPNKYMPGGSVQRYNTGGTTTRTIPTGATGSESSLSNWAGDYVTNMLGQGAALANAPYQAYTGPLTAGASGLQNQAFTQAGGLQTPASIGQAATTAGGIATALQGTNYQPTQFANAYTAPGQFQTGQFANQFKAPTQSAETKFTNTYTAPGQFQTGQFDTDTFGASQAQQYMNPYLQSALDPQLKELQRQSDIARMSDAGRLTQAGAFGGSRQAIMESEGRRNLLDKQQDVLGQGYNTAYQTAMQQFNADQARRQAAQQATEQSRQFGAGQAANAAQLQAQYGLSAQQAQEAARQFAAGQSMTAAQLMAQYGLSAQQAQEASRQFGAGQAANVAQQQAQFGLAGQQAGEQSRQFGANLGLQGLQGALSAAQAQGQLGALQGQTDLAGLKGLLEAGGVERGIESEGIAADKAQFEEARLNPYKMVQFQQSLLSGLPLASQSYNMPGTSNLQQFASGATTLQQLLDILSGKTTAAPK